MPALSYPSVARNRQPILQVLRSQIESLLRPDDPLKTLNVVEIASGTGEHAAFFSSHIPHLIYQPTEPEIAMVDSITSWAADLHSDESKSVVLPPLTLAATQLSNPSVLPSCMQRQPSNAFKSLVPVVDLVLCINMIHISPFQSTVELFTASQLILKPGGAVILYGPFREDSQGKPTCESNEAFDRSLRDRNPLWGIRDLKEVVDIAALSGLSFVGKEYMPANNLCVTFQKDQ